MWILSYFLVSEENKVYTESSYVSHPVVVGWIQFIIHCWLHASFLQADIYNSTYIILFFFVRECRLTTMLPFKKHIFWSPNNITCQEDLSRTIYEEAIVTAVYCMRSVCESVVDRKQYTKLLIFSHWMPMKNFSRTLFTLTEILLTPCVTSTMLLNIIF